MRRVACCFWLISLGAMSIANGVDVVPRSDREPFPQSAKIARDRRADGVLDAVRQQIARQDFASAIAGLQELLDGPNAFVSNATEVHSIIRTANNLLGDLPPAGRAAYERAFGAEAERLRQAALRSGHMHDLRAVVTRFEQTVAGWHARRDLLAWHVDRGEWHLAIAAGNELSRHPLSAKANQAGWVNAWSLGLRQSGDVARADQVLREWKGRASLSVAQDLSTSPTPPRSAIADWSPSTAEALPFGGPLWQHAVDWDGDSKSYHDEIESAWRRDNLLTLPSSAPLVIGDIVVARFPVPSKIVAVDVRQAKLLWERPDHGESLVGSATELQRHPSFRDSLMTELERRWFGDSVRGRLTSDGRRVFVVQDAESLDVRPGSGTRVRNHLTALDLQTGERIWRVGGPLREPPDELHGEYFLGPPLASDGFLYVVAQRETVLRLMALRADDGQLEWSVPIAESDRRQFKESSWRHNACGVTWSGDCLICPTGASCFVAVDPVTRSLAWSVAFDRDDIENANGQLVVDRDKPPAERWWQSWREGFFATLNHPAAETTLIAAVPESRSVHGIDSRRGRIVWRHEFDEPILLAQQAASPVLVFERHEVSIVDPHSGEIRHRLAFPAPAAAGSWIGTRYVCPQRDGTWAAIDVAGAEPKIVRSMPALHELHGASGARAGRSTLVGDRWVSVSADTVEVRESLAGRRAVKADSTPKADSTKTDSKEAIARLEPAWMTLSAGEFDAAVSELRTLADDDAVAPLATRALRHALLRDLSDDRLLPRESERELLAVSREPAEKSEAIRALIAASRKRSDSEAALRLVLDHIELASDSDVEVTDVRRVVEGTVLSLRPSRRIVRRDRWLQGAIADLLADATPDSQAKLRKLLLDRKQQAAESLDPFELAQFGERLSSLPIGQQIVLQLAGRSGSGNRFIPTVLALHDLAGHRDRATAAEAWYRLALLHEFRSEPLEAADAYRQLRDRFADVKLADGRAVTAWLADVSAESTIGKLGADDARDPWPVATPQISRAEEPHDDIYFHDITVESSDPSWRRLSVAIERQGRKVRFHGERHRGVWDLPLPASRSVWRHVYEMQRAWGVGPLLILQVGAELFGIQPLDERGEANARVLWSRPVNPDADQFGAELRLARLGFTVDELVRLDQNEQPVLEVVHVGPGQILFRSGESLTALDPSTGGLQWRRHDLRPRTTVSADQEVVVIEHPVSAMIEVLRTVDGKPIAWRSDSSRDDLRLMTHGRSRLRKAASAPDAATSNINTDGGQLAPNRPAWLVRDDLVSGAIVWSRELPPGAMPLRIDHERLAVLEPSGLLRMIAMADGHELARHNIEMPKTLAHLHVIGDSRRLYLVVSDRAAETAWLNVNQDRGGYHRLLVNGWLHGFDRETLAKQWTIRLDHVSLSVDQAPDLPFLLLTYRRPADSGETPDGAVQVIDKRDGAELLLEVGGPNLINVGVDPRPADGVVILLTKSHRIRFDFAK